MALLAQEADVISNVAHVIQLAVAPVFLLTGIGGILSVLINRLARVVDRFRVLDQDFYQASENAIAHIRQEMQALSQRARMIHWAIGLCTVCALFVCVVIALMFLSAMLGVDLSTTVSVLFILAMLMLIAGLLCFLHEIRIATSSIDVTPR